MGPRACSTCRQARHKAHVETAGERARERERERETVAGGALARETALMGRKGWRETHDGEPALTLLLVHAVALVTPVVAAAAGTGVDHRWWYRFEAPMRRRSAGRNGRQDVLFGLGPPVERGCELVDFSPARHPVRGHGAVSA